MHYKKLSDTKPFPTFIRVIMIIVSVSRVLSFLTWILSFAFLFMYSLKYINYTKKEKETIYCPWCMTSYVVCIIASSVHWLVDALSMSNTIGAYIRNHYGADINSSADVNFEAVCDINDDNQSRTVKCLGCGCFSCLGVIYYKDTLNPAIRSSTSKCIIFGNYMCFSLAPFPWTRQLVKKLGYGKAVVANFVIMLFLIILSLITAIYGVMCVANNINCLEI